VVRNFRLAAVYAAAVALMLRALVPVGWMPNTGAEQHSAFMPCPMLGGTRMPMPMPGQHPTKHDPPSHEGSICPYAATAHFTPPPAIGVSRPTRFAAAQCRSQARLSFLSGLVLGWDHAPRAPPASAI
jgi:hypothetical protein